MKYITDTDFLPHLMDDSYDVYQLLYGVLINGTEVKIYDTIISLCRKYKEPLLRNAKISAWERATREVISTLKSFTTEDTEIYVPFISLHCSISRLVNLYEFALNVLGEVYDMEMKTLIRKNKATSIDVRSFYPIPRMTDLMKAFAEECRHNDGLGEDAARAVEEEMGRRGLEVEVSSFSSENQYERIFFKGAALPKITYKQQEEEGRKQGKKEDYLVKTGYLYYALKHYISEVKPQATKERIRRITEDATIRIAHGLFKPTDYFSPSDKASETFYQYVHYKKFNNVRTEERENNYNEIVSLLDKYKLTPPDEPLVGADKK